MRLELVVLGVEGLYVLVLLQRPVNELAFLVRQGVQVGEDLVQGVLLLLAEFQLVLVVGRLNELRGLQTGSLGP